LLFGFFGLNALLIILSSLLIAITTGLIYLILESKGMVECRQCKKDNTRSNFDDFSIIKDIRNRIKEYNFSFKIIKKSILGTLKGSWALTKMVMWWLLIGMLMAAFARAYIPHEFFMIYMGPTLIGILVTLFFAVIIEVCSEGSSPLAFEIYNQTGAFGNSFTFLMAGVASDYTEIGLIWHNIGKRAAIWLPIITIPQIIVLGYIFNLIL
jgi:uncharacterized membrane protein YraQ (UPF0718 family)